MEPLANVFFDVLLDIFAHAKYRIERCSHIMRDRGSKHLQVVILEFKLLILDEVSDAFSNDHLMLGVFEEN